MYRNSHQHHSIWTTTTTKLYKTSSSNLFGQKKQHQQKLKHCVQIAIIQHSMFIFFFFEFFFQGKEQEKHIYQKKTGQGNKKNNTLRHFDKRIIIWGEKNTNNYAEVFSSFSFSFFLLCKY